MTTLRRTLVLSALTVLAALLAGLAVLDPFHLRHAPWFVAGTVLLLIVLATATLAVAVRPLRVPVGALGGVVAAGWVVLALLGIDLREEGRPVSEVVSGGQRLVVLDRPILIDPAFAVVLRAGAGPFEQESPVWDGAAEGSAPDAVAFRGADEVEVRVGSCVLVSRVEPVTLAVDPAHREADGCRAEGS